MKTKHTVQAVLLHAYETGTKVSLGEVALGSLVLHAEVDPLDLDNAPDAERTAYMYVVARHHKTVTKCLTVHDSDSMSYLASLTPSTQVVIMTPQKEIK